MRFLLALLAVVALIVSPVTAATAMVACGQGDASAMAGMDMPGMHGEDHAGATKAAGAACCDHASQHGKKADTNCAKVCAVSCSVAVALAGASCGVLSAPIRADVPLARIVSSQPHEPSGLKRPPKSIA